MRYVISIFISLAFCSCAFADYVVVMKDGKGMSTYKVSKEYISKHSNDPESPINIPGAIVVENLDGIEIYQPPKTKSVEERLKAIEKKIGIDE